jgi:hypothetical protein
MGAPSDGAELRDKGAVEKCVLDASTNLSIMIDGEVNGCESRASENAWSGARIIQQVFQQRGSAQAGTVATRCSSPTAV